MKIMSGGFILTIDLRLSKNIHQQVAIILTYYRLPSLKTDWLEDTFIKSPKQFCSGVLNETIISNQVNQNSDYLKTMSSIT